LWVRVNIITGINLVGLLLICVVIHGARMAIKVCVSNCKIDFCNGADYDTKMHHVQWSAITVTIKILKNKSATTVTIKIWNRKSVIDTMRFLSWT
jgi:hypothetical protein